MKTAEKTKALGFCAACGRDIAVRSDKLVHHGYKRPGHGESQGDCLGVGSEPHEISTKLADLVREMTQNRKGAATAQLGRLERDEVSVLYKQSVLRQPDGRRVSDVRAVQRDLTDSEWRLLRNNAVREEQYTIARCDLEIKRVATLLTDWSVKALRLVTVAPKNPNPTPRRRWR